MKEKEAKEPALAKANVRSIIAKQTPLKPMSVRERRKPALSRKQPSKKIKSRESVFLNLRSTNDGDRGLFESHEIIPTFYKQPERSPSPELRRRDDSIEQIQAYGGSSQPVSILKQGRFSLP